MLELLLLRHAKSSWRAAEVEDHDRDLAPRGLKAARQVGRLLRERQLIPDLALCSTATRAQRTWEIVTRELGREVPTRHLRSLYLAPPSRLLEVIGHQEPNVRRLLLIGHNPGIHGLAQRLATGGEAAALQRLRLKFPTAALALIGSEAAGWADLPSTAGRLLGFWCPRDLD